MRVALFIAFHIVFAAFSPLAAQDGGLEAFGEIIDVRVLNLEVAVSGKDGEHVPGLGSEDFRLRVDGREVAIEYFSEIRQGTAEAPPAGPPAVSAPLASVPTVTPGEAVGTSFLLFVDNYFGHARDRRLVLEGIAEKVARFGPADRMAVVAFDGSRLDLVGGWESSPAALAETLQEAMELPARGLERRAEADIFQLQLNSLQQGVIEEGDKNVQVQYIRKLSGQVETVVKAATTAMRSLASPPGRKVMLLTSGGWPDDPSTFTTGLDPEIRNRTRRYSPRAAFDDLASTANLLGYTIYPIDLPGSQTRRASAADRTGGTATTPDAPITDAATSVVRGVDTGAAESQGGGGLVFGDSGLSPREAVSRQRATALADFDATSGREHAVESPLIALAAETGGRAMLNHFRETALERTLLDTGSYYWLGITPTWARDDEEHEVRVEVLRRGIEARSRRGFKDLSRQAEVTMMVESNLLFSTRLGGHSLAAELGPAKKASRGKIEVPVSLTIPLDHIVMLPVAGGFEARLELRVAVLDAKGARSEIPVIPITLGGAAKPPPGAHAVYDTALALRKIEQRLALALYDLAGEKILATSIDFDPGSI